MVLSIILGSLQSTTIRAEKRALLGCSVDDAKHELWVQVHELKSIAKVSHQHLSRFAKISPPAKWTKNIDLPTTKKSSDLFDVCKSLHSWYKYHKWIQLQNLIDI